MQLAWTGPYLCLHWLGLLPSLTCSQGLFEYYINGCVVGGKVKCCKEDGYHTKYLVVHLKVGHVKNPQIFRSEKLNLTESNTT